MAKKGILFLLIIGLFVFVGCEETPPNTTLEWTTVATEWTTDDDWQLSYVSTDEGDHIDLGWNQTVGDPSTEQRCYLFEENYSIENNVLSGQYTKEGDETLYDIVITFNYNESTNTVSFSCVGEGILNGESFTFYPDPYFN
ncbi:MAG: hypothetical protein PWP25_1250 [Sphaerochaeta sp.]|jgi:hypothetical protein|nr:hypothetical protein [Sphaerochaeta sp.]MDN5334932.1 hypothetical protein [Sphaerochaeta sp.]